MTCRFPLFTALAALAACAAPPGGSGVRSTADRDAVAAVLQRQVEAWNRGDLAGFMEGYARTPALVFTSGAVVRRGWQEAFDGYTARYGGNRAGMGSLQLEILSIDPVGDGGAVVLGRWELTGTAQAGSGVFSVVLERRPEGWRIVHDHTSVDRAD